MKNRGKRDRQWLGGETSPRRERALCQNGKKKLLMTPLTPSKNQRKPRKGQIFLFYNEKRANGFMNVVAGPFLKISRGKTPTTSGTLYARGELPIVRSSISRAW